MSVASLAVVGVAGPPLARGDGGWKVPEPPDNLEFFQGKSWGPLTTQIVTIGKDDRGDEVAEGVFTSVRLTNDGDTVVYYNANFAPLHSGDVIPILGWLYQLSSFGTVQLGRAPRAHMWAKRLDGTALAGFAPRPDSVIIPLTPGTAGGTQFANCLVRLLEAGPGGGKGKPASGRLQVGYRGPGDKPLAVIEEAAVKAGDVVLVRDKGYKVVSIVPPDADTHVIGWLELDPSGVSEKELVEKKVPFVRPTKVPDKK